MSLEEKIDTMGFELQNSGSETIQARMYTTITTLKNQVARPQSYKNLH